MDPNWRGRSPTPSRRNWRLLESSEFALYTIDREIAGRHAELTRDAVIGDVRDRARMADVMGTLKPELVFHAAALKHVPLVEANPIEGVLTNAIGTRVVADAALAAGVRLMVLISTDKAVNPSSIMGMAKRAAETYCQALDAEANSTRIITVRFGNVLGSTGSVVPLFRQQLAAGGPITVTHPDMTRYFMTVREAVELVLQASALGDADQSWRGRVFVLDMGEPVAHRRFGAADDPPGGQAARYRCEDRIHPVCVPAKNYSRKSSTWPSRPKPTGRNGILAASARRYERAQVAAVLDAIEDRCRALDTPGMLDALRCLVPEYAPGG